MAGIIWLEIVKKHYNELCDNILSTLIDNLDSQGLLRINKNLIAVNKVFRHDEHQSC